MPRVRSYRRRDGVRVRSHHRTARRPEPELTGRQWLLLGGAGAGLCLLWRIAVFIDDHPYWSILIGAALVAGIAAVARPLLRSRREQDALAAERARQIAATDAMTGTEFENWVAGVLRRSGFTDVHVCGGANDRGADIIAFSPGGRRTVVQCKRYGVNNPVRSAAIQTFAGTCRTVHRGEICMIVTNGRFSNGDGVVLARELNIVLVDREQLAAWAVGGVAPQSVTIADRPPAAGTGGGSRQSRG